MNRLITGFILGFLASGCSDSGQSPEQTNAVPEAEVSQYELVLEGGRVIDPESGLDAVRNVGITNGQIKAVTDEPLSGETVVDVTGLVVAPGFVNVHSHAWTPLGQVFEVQDGVTTALELEAGAFPVGNFGTFEPIAIDGKSRINFGASVGHAFIRSAILEGDSALSGADEMVSRAMAGEPQISMERPAFREPLSAEQRSELREHLVQGLIQGGLGIGMLLDYMSEVVDEQEMRIIFELAAEHQAPISVHVRRGVAGDTTGLLEVIQLARETGAPVHICHIQASGMGNVAEFLRLIRKARDEGMRITTESFPYNAGSTSNNAAVFNRDWQKIFAITYEDVEWAATGERFDEAMWNEYREKYPGGTVIHHYNKEEWTSIPTNATDVAVASDGIPIVSLEIKVAPFGIGTNARVLGRYVREKGSLSLTDAIAKMTLLPASVLDAYSPSMAQKSRIQPGKDADITIFDPETVIDNGTYQDPYQASSGIIHVLVNGQFVVRNDELVEDAFPGKRVLR
jgi:N-acyl-D-aspartate/D-glutamate deacylase